MKADGQETACLTVPKLRYTKAPVLSQGSRAVVALR